MLVVSSGYQWGHGELLFSFFQALPHCNLRLNTWCFDTLPVGPQGARRHISTLASHRWLSRETTPVTPQCNVALGLGSQVSLIVDESSSSLSIPSRPPGYYNWFCRAISLSAVARGMPQFYSCVHCAVVYLLHSRWMPEHCTCSESRPDWGCQFMRPTHTAMT